MELLKVDNINVYYGSIHAIKDVSFTVNEGEVVTLIGANGAGKSTILNTVSGLLRSKTGTVDFLGQSINHVPPHKIVAMGMAHCPEGRPGVHQGDDPQARHTLGPGLIGIGAGGLTGLPLVGPAGDAKFHRLVALELHVAVVQVAGHHLFHHRLGKGSSSRGAQGGPVQPAVEGDERSQKHHHDHSPHQQKPLFSTLSNHLHLSDSFFFNSRMVFYFRRWIFPCQSFQQRQTETLHSSYISPPVPCLGAKKVVKESHPSPHVLPAHLI